MANLNGCYAYNTIEHAFKGNRVISRHLTPVNWELVIKLSGIDMVGTEDEVSAQREMILATYQKLQWWLNNYVNDIFLTSLGDPQSNDVFFDGEFDNIFVCLPTNPSDDLFIEALHRKLTVLSEGYLHILELSLRSDDFNSTYYFSEQAGYRLPMDNSMYEGNALHEVPWWNRADCDMWEPIILEDGDREEMYDLVETFTDMEDFVDEFITYLRKDESSEPEPLDPPVIGIDKWKPKLV